MLSLFTGTELWETGTVVNSADGKNFSCPNTSVAKEDEY